jgi:radical SAM protein with 4Fe4S-binding SPASM domain
MRELVDHHGYVPRTCVWEITRACNLNCGHCGTAAGHPRTNELSTDECVDLVGQLARLGNRLITLSGGEPTVRSDWPVIGRAAVDAGITVNMVTNGQADPDRLAEQTREAGLANVAVSLDGLRATHDSIRRTGSFDRTTATIRKLTLAGIWVDVMFTVNRRNISELEAVYRLARELGARRLRVQIGKPMGNQTHRDDLTLQPVQLLTLLPLLGRLAKAKGPTVRVGDSVGYYSREERLLRGDCSAQGHWTGCYAGCQTIGIQSDGGIKGCLSLQPRAGEPDRFVEGNVRERPLAEIWHAPDAFAYNRAFHVDQLSGACRQCTHARICRGGANCVSHAYTGKLGCDPMCYYRVCEQGDHARRVWPLSAAAAAAAVIMGLGGCAADDDGSGSDDETGATDSETGDTGGDTGDGATDDGGTGGTDGGTTGGDTSGGTSTGTGGTGTGGTGTGGTGTGGTDTTGGTGTETSTGGTGTVTPTGSFDCEQVDCYAEYGAIPPDVFQYCCCEGVDCNADYGDPPPPGCCP